LFQRFLYNQFLKITIALKINSIPKNLGIPKIISHKKLIGNYLNNNLDVLYFTEK